MARFYKIPNVTRREFVKTRNNMVNSRESQIMLLGLDPTYFERLGSIPWDLKMKNKKFFVLSTNTETQSILRKNNLKFFSFGDFINSEIRNKCKIYEKIFKMHWKRIKNDEKFQRLFDYDGIRMFKILKEEIKDILMLRFPWAIYYIEAAMNSFKSQKVKLVISIDDAITVTRAVVLAAKSKGIKTLVVQNGNLGNPAGFGFIPVLADKMAVWGDITRDLLIKMGVESKKLVVTGNPQEKQIKDISTEKEFYHRLGIDKNKKIILVTTQAFGDIYSEKNLYNLIKTVISALDKIHNAQLIIKIHPRERKEFYEAILREFGRKDIIIAEDNFEELLNICTVLITISSTSALDALSRDKPVIISNVLKRPNVIPYAESRAAMSADNSVEMAEIINNIRKMKNEKLMKKFVYLNSYKNDGKSGERIIKLMEKMINHKI